MIEFPNECEICQTSMDFGKQCSANCFTCGKQFMCVECGYIHECIPGKSRILGVITNPQWVMNLRKSLGVVKENENRSGNTDSDKA